MVTTGKKYLALGSLVLSCIAMLMVNYFQDTPQDTSSQKPLPLRPMLSHSDGLNIPFVENAGQYADKTVRYVAGIFRGAVAVKEKEVVYALVENRTEPPKELNSFSQAMAAREENNPGAKVAAFGVRYLTEQGVASSLNPQGLDKSQTVVSDHRAGTGNRQSSKLGAWNAVALGEVWPGVEVELRAHEKNVEQLFYVSPGHRPEQIALNFSGIKQLSIDEQGELVIEHSQGRYSLTKPVGYQATSTKENSRIEK